jgi:hypothetical protein
VRHQAELGTVALVAAAHPPEIRFDGFARSRSEGAARAGGATFAACMLPFAQGCAPPLAARS